MRRKLFRTEFERLRAIYRNSEFLKEFEEMETMGTSEDPLRNKWNIKLPFLLPPEEFKKYEKRHLENPFPLFEDRTVSILGTSNLKLKNKQKLTDKGWEIIDDEIDWASLLKDDKYLRVSIDLTAGIGDVLKATTYYYDYFKQYIKKPEGRNSSSDFDPFEIYDLHKEMNLAEIARMKTGFKGNPSNPPDSLSEDEANKFKSTYERIRTEYKIAVTLIEQVAKETRQS